MKKLIIPLLLFMVAFLSYSPIGEAKSYSIDKVHIKSWIQPNGDLLVNEVFTYTFDGSFHNLYREFPDTYNERLVDFYSYELTSLDMEPGFVGAESMIPLTASFEDGYFRTKINKSNETVSYFYAYTLKDAVKSYENYSEINVTYFSGDAHDQTYENVTIDFILPQPLNPNSFEGFMFDRHAGKREKNQYGIRFVTPKSQAYSTTETSFYFPSSVMTAIPKIKSTQTLSGAIALEQQQFEKMQSRLDNNGMVKSFIPKVVIGMLIVAFLFLVILPQRHFWRTGSEKDVIETDVLYMFFVDRVGNTHKKSFLAGLFSLVEKGAVKVSNGKAAVRFQNDPKAPRETLEFQLVNRSLVNADFENTMIDWLFGVKNGSNKWTFNLHDIAGAAKKEKSPHTYFAHQKKTFKRKKEKWELAVESELKEAGAFKDWIPLIVLSIATILLAILFSIAYYVDLRSGWGIAYIVVVSLLYIMMQWWKKKKKRWLFIYVACMFLASISLVDEELFGQTISLLVAFLILYIAIPRNILSMNAVRAKDSIRTFRKELSQEDNSLLNKDDKWIIRAYLFKRRRSSYPLETADATPVAGLLLTDTDPIKYVEDSWHWTKGGLFSGGGSSGGSTTYSDSGGSYGGGSSGGGASAD